VSAAELHRDNCDLDHAHVFVGADGGLYRRSNFSRRFWRPATDGNLDKLGHRLPGVRGIYSHVTPTRSPV
jgi:hypothetical protein